MAVFLSASDESDGGHHRSPFWHGGWVAPETDWTRYFVPAWQERVLDAKPKIPFLHVTDIRDADWRKEHGVSWLQAQDKLDEAVSVLDCMGSFYPIATQTDGGVFLDAHGKKKIIDSATGKKGARFLVDHYSFNLYVYAVLHYIKARHPDAEKVDFFVERKEGVFEKLKQFYDSFEEVYAQIGEPELAKYLGDVVPVGKDRVPVQAADVLCWYTSRNELGVLNGRDAIRAAKLLHRKGKLIPIPDKMHHELAHAFAEKLNEQEHGVSEVRHHDGGATSSSSRQAKKGTGRGKGRQGKKAKKAEV